MSERSKSRRSVPWALFVVVIGLLYVLSYAPVYRLAYGPDSPHLDASLTLTRWDPPSNPRQRWRLLYLPVESLMDHLARQSDAGASKKVGRDLRSFVDEAADVESRPEMLTPTARGLIKAAQTDPLVMPVA